MKPAVRQVVEKRYQSDIKIDTYEDALHLIIGNFFDLDREAFITINLDKDDRPINFCIQHVGSLDRSVIHPREIFKSALLSNASSFVAIHNHPSGSLVFSQADKDSKEALDNVGDLLEIPLKDFLIFNPNQEFVSINDEEDVRKLNENEIQLSLEILLDESSVLESVGTRQNLLTKDKQYQIATDTDVEKFIQGRTINEGDERLNTVLYLNKQNIITGILRFTNQKFSLKQIMKEAVLSNASRFIFVRENGIVNETSDIENFEILNNVGSTFGISLLDYFTYNKGKVVSYRKDYPNLFNNYIQEDLKTVEEIKVYSKYENLTLRGYILNDKDEIQEIVYFKSSPNNIASFIMHNKTNKVVVTDLKDSLIVTSEISGFIDRCPDQDYLQNYLHPAILKIQLEDEKPKEIDYIIFPKGAIPIYENSLVRISQDEGHSYITNKNINSLSKFDLSDKNLLSEYIRYIIEDPYVTWYFDDVKEVLFEAILNSSNKDIYLKSLTERLEDIEMQNDEFGNPSLPEDWFIFDKNTPQVEIIGFFNEMQSSHYFELEQ